jgi:hypothetical protein
LQFIKDCAYDAALAENNTASGLKPDISLRYRNVNLLLF